MRNGYIGATPERPTIAFSITLFEIYRQIHCVCPRLSIYGFTKALSNIHGVCIGIFILSEFSQSVFSVLTSTIMQSNSLERMIAISRSYEKWSSAARFL